MHDDYVIPEAGPEREVEVIRIGTEMVSTEVRAALVVGAEKLKAGQMTVDEYAVLTIDKMLWANAAMTKIRAHAAEIGALSADYAHKLKGDAHASG